LIVGAYSMRPCDERNPFWIESFARESGGRRIKEVKIIRLTGEMSGSDQIVAPSSCKQPVMKEPHCAVRASSS